MIYTVTFNPAIDYLVFMDQLKIGATNRTASEEYFYGGKGINVSTILSTLGVENTALGFVSGWTGKALVEGLQEKGIRADAKKPRSTGRGRTSPKRPWNRSSGRSTP